ncbi:MAG TPA: DUF3617 family protein [Burkholderiales bacterium]|nr:DUF3617 family protein [Burkholderiales bacterium]
MRHAFGLFLGVMLSVPALADSNPMQPGTWEFTRSGGMAANLIGRFCITAADIADPMSPVNGFLSRDEKKQCSNWQIQWQAGRAEYSGACRWKDQTVEVSGRIVASADTYSDTQDQKKEGSASRSPILDIINGLRLAACPN